jgi:DNA-3-methyladenine glycosylase
MKPLDADFYARPVLEVARDLLGCTVLRGEVAGVIVETEAYHESEPACHAFVGLTARTRTLFGPPGRAYVYRSYGIHALLNAVCEAEGVGAAVLIRALEPARGLDAMRQRRAGARRLGAGPSRPRRSRASALGRADRELCSGPGKLTEALGVTLADNDCDLFAGPVRILARDAGGHDPRVAVGTRIGITRAAELRWRFCVAGHPDVSSPRLPRVAAAADGLQRRRGQPGGATPPA